MVARREAASSDGLLVTESASAAVETDASPRAVDEHHLSVVDRVLVTGARTGERVARVRLRSSRQPAPGDKFASRHSQKGVCGLLVEEEDMPYTQDGVRPDVIINPHGMPTRMTMGHLLESLAAKCAAHSARLEDATAFDTDAPALLARAARVLAAAGLDPLGEETLFSPATGLPVAGSVFLCPIYYQRLKHMAKDKVKARAGEGPLSAVSRQPAGATGSTRPLKVGEMETAAILGHGAASFLQEALMQKSDATDAWFDSEGQRAASNAGAGIFRSVGNAHDPDVRRASLPYGFGAFQHELAGLGIGTEVRLA